MGWVPGFSGSVNNCELQWLGPVGTWFAISQLVGIGKRESLNKEITEFCKGLMPIRMDLWSIFINNSP
jgi:hypothetical protein